MKIKTKQDNEPYVNKFFAICDKCDNKIYEHLGYTEFPPGHYTINVKCELCGTLFQHHIWSPTAHRAFKAEQAAKLMNKDVIAKMTKEVMKKMTGRDK